MNRLRCILIMFLVGCSAKPLPRSLAPMRAAEFTIEVSSPESTTLIAYKVTGGVGVKWSTLSNANWLPEWSTNLTDWNYCQSETVYWDLYPFRHTHETATVWPQCWFRLRKVYP